VEVWEDAGGWNWTGERVETDVEILERGAVVEVRGNGSGEGIVREINASDGRESRDFPGDYSGERVSTQIEQNQFLTVPNVPRNRTVDEIPLQFELIQLLTPNEIRNFTNDVRRSRGEDLEISCIPNGCRQRASERVSGDVEVMQVTQARRNLTMEVVAADI